MAYHPMRQRDPLFERDVQQALERRGRELMGLALIGLGAAIAAMLASYTPEDPSWMSATDAPARNHLGRGGAAVAAGLMVTIGLASWGLAVLAFGWGLRLVLHQGADRLFSRIILFPIPIALAAVYASTHVPFAGWNHTFGLGGLFGDTVLGGILSTMPEQAAVALRIISGLSGVALLGMALFVLGVSLGEMRRFARFLLVGLVLSYGALVEAMGRGFVRLAEARRNRAERMEARSAERTGPTAFGPSAAASADRPGGRAPRLAAPAASGLVRRPAPPASEPEPVFPEEEPPLQEDPPARPSILPRLPRLIGLGGGREGRVAPEPELVETTPRLPEDIDAPGEDRIRARIMDAIRSRTRTPLQVPGGPGAALPSTAAPATGSGFPAVAGAAGLAGGAPGGGATAMSAAGPASGVIPPLTRRAGAQGISPVAHAPRIARDEPLFEEDEAELDPGFDEQEEEDLPTPAQAGRAALSLPRAVPEPRAIVQHPTLRATPPSRRATAEAQPAFRFEEPAPSAYEPPPLSLLARPIETGRAQLSDEALEANARMLETVLDDYGVRGEIVSVRPGPVVTMYELEPAPGLKASRVIGLADDIARSMSALSARVSTVPGRSVIGIELPNVQREKVFLREILAARAFDDTGLKLPLALGKDISGAPVVASLAKMPHLLIAGTTGSGKSVAINTMILSLLYKLTPEECRLIMIDPKMLELSVYDGIPHLLSPVVTDPRKAVVALKWVVGEMEDRYRKMSRMGVRNIEGYNSRVRDALDKGEMFVRTVQTGFDDETGEPVFETQEFQPETLPFVVVIVDEMADLMMVAGKEIEACIQRLAQMARASGIHLIMATQRPSVDVITGTIKANFPTRISFQVTSKIDSRTILGEQGAEQLLGQGDMLYMAGGGRIQRVHGPFVSDEEVEEIVTHLKSFGPPDYRSGVTDGPDEDRESDIDAVLGLGGGAEGDEALYDQAVAIVARDRKCSTSYIQRKLAIGYNKAARLVEQMEEQGVVSPANHVGKREVLVEER